ncbi:MAG: hypothetical protein AAF328_00500 [Planctomycetota bacterium]
MINGAANGLQQAIVGAGAGDDGSNTGFAKTTRHGSTRRALRLGPVERFCRSPLEDRFGHIKIERLIDIDNVPGLGHDRSTIHAQKRVGFIRENDKKTFTRDRDDAAVQPVKRGKVLPAKHPIGDMLNHAIFAVSGQFLHPIRVVLTHRANALNRVTSGFSQFRDRPVREIGGADRHVAVKNHNRFETAIRIDGLNGVPRGRVDAGGAIGKHMRAMDRFNPSECCDLLELVPIGREHHSIHTGRCEDMVEGPINHGLARAGQRIFSGQTLASGSGKDDGECGHG